MLFAQKKCLAKFVAAFFFALFLLSVNAQAQKKKVVISQKDKASQTNSKNKTADKKTSSTKEKTAKSKADVQKEAEAKRLIEIEKVRRRAAEEARRQAAVAEQRRRAQAIREARARKLAFERGLRTETVENIVKDNTDGEDLEIRRAAINALGNHAGTVVVLEAQTGKILTIVNQDWAIRHSFKPCSTIKLVTAVAGLNEKLIDESGNLRATNFRLNLDDALAYSNNSYFQKVGAGLGNEKMIAYAQTLGLGQTTGINADGETSGKLPFGNKNARVYSHGDDFEVTPLQLAVLVSAISNGGKMVVPQIPRTKFERANFRGILRRNIALPPKDLQGVIPGMIGAARYGTARRGVDSSLAVAGKTGSCIGQGSWLGLFASVAPIENPKFAVIVITRGQAERGKYAAAIAGNIYQTLSRRFDEKGNTNLALIPLELKPKPKVDAKTSAQMDTDEDEDSDDNDATPKGKKGGADILTTRETVEKKAEKSTPVFAPVIIKVKKAASNEITRPRIVPGN
jgi:membrane peptidoglycan carboxypeptidase